MSQNVLPFPLNRQNWLRRIHDAMQAGDKEQAIELIETLSRQESLDTDTQTVYVSLLLDTQQHERLATFFDAQSPDAYLAEDATVLACLYGRWLLDTNQLSAAQQWIQRVIEAENVSYELVQMVALLNEDVQRCIVQSRTDLVTSVSHWVEGKSLPFFRQQQLVRQLTEYPLDFWERWGCALLALPNECVHPLLKTHLLDQLATQHATVRLSMDWFGTRRTVSVPDIVPVRDTVFYQQASCYHSEKLDPQSVLLVQQNAQLYGALLYPFAEEVCRDSAAFLDFLAQGDSAHTADNPDWALLQRLEPWLLAISQ